MKCVVIGDTHGRTIWRDIVKKEYDADKYIFLGDYVSTHDPNVTDDQQIEELYGILDFKENNKDKVVLLRGNHDGQALGYHWADCNPRVSESVARYMRTDDVKGWFLNSTQWVYRMPDTNIVCSHAGISEKFLENVRKHLFGKVEGKEYSTEFIINQINSIEPCELFGFTPCKLSDYTGESATQPCTWIRPYTLLEYGIKDIIQVVGHTPTKSICNIKELVINASKVFEEDDLEQETLNNVYGDIWLCDALEKKQYLVIQDGKFIPKTLEDGV